MSKHTTEPWRVSNSPWLFEDSSERKIGKVFSDGFFPKEEDEANCRRIVACVNVLAGLTTEEIENGILKQVIEKVAEALDKFKAKHNIKMGEP